MKSMRDNLKKSANIETPRREEEGADIRGVGTRKI